MLEYKYHLITFLSFKEVIRNHLIINFIKAYDQCYSKYNSIDQLHQHVDS